MSFIPMLSTWQWLLLAMVPPAIILLYFLKLKRQPLEVPSTYLWLRSIEDLHVNSIWQRLRKNLLLLLQLLIVLLAIFALLRPGWSGTKLLDNRLVFLVDNSASMSSTDVAPSRLDEAKKRIGQLIDQMDSGAVAMLISFSDSARVEQSFTDNRRLLRKQLDAIAPTNRTTRLGEALRVAAGLANPGRAFESGERQIGEALPATLYIVSDGRFPDVEGFSLGNLKPVFMPIGNPECKNLGITAFSVKPVEGKPGQIQAFARVEHCGAEEIVCELELYLDDELKDSKETRVSREKPAGVVFDLEDIHSGILRLQVSQGGDLKVDDVAWAVVNPPQRGQVLLVTPGDDALQLALQTSHAAEMAEVSIASPDILKTKEYQQAAASGHYQLVIYDQCQPTEMPRANTLFIGTLPIGDQWSAGKKVPAPQVIDIDTTHPMMQLIDLGNVKFAEGVPIKGPPGSRMLIDSDVGTLFAIAPREGFEDAVLGVEIVSTDEKGDRYANTDWPLRLSFPVFVFNTLQYLAGGRETTGMASLQPGQAVNLRSQGKADRLSLETPNGKTINLERGRLGSFTYSATDDLGIYTVREEDKVVDRFAVNLFDGLESNIPPRAENTIKIGYVDVKGEASSQTARQEIWRPLALIALVVLIFEWYIYNRRVYL